MTQVPQHFHLALDPQADPQAVIIRPMVRFTLLADRLIRMEYSPEDHFEDRASQVFWYRRQPVPEFSIQEKGGILEIETAYLRLAYVLDRPFAFDSLSIELRESGKVWRYGDPNPGNLGGTLRTLDFTNGPVPLPSGLVSRDGWSLVDDSATLVFDLQSWLEPRNSAPGSLDLYFFGYGHDYQGCIGEFMRVAGHVPVIPRWALGNWWSRYWAYSQDELTQLMLEFESHEIPLSVCIVDMDWHITQTGNECTGWTGYTWNRELFPDPDSFIAFLHSKGLKTALNLHPAEGVHAHEEAYYEIAKCMGMDPEEKLPVPFDLANPLFAEAYFRILHHPEEKRGVDFWWLDWQQGSLTQMPGLDPLWWLNHLHALDRAREGDQRPFTFSRWGGLGNHRYPIGFSGDSIVTWDTLAFQPHFTATAANVGYGWWSHDIGGHVGGIEDAELYTRWVQFGVFSPILRLHSTKNPYHQRLPWGYDAETFKNAQNAFKLRHALIPYIYSMAWQEHSQNIPLVRPMYYSNAEEEAAYHCPDQYWFGSELIAAPFISAALPDTRLARQVVWLPAGDWFDFFTGERLEGASWQTFYGTPRDIPVFARAGAIVPLDPQPDWDHRGSPDSLEIHIFPGADNHFELYEDEGEGQGYLAGRHFITTFKLEWEGDRLTFTALPGRGEVELAPPLRKIELVFHGVRKPGKVSMLFNDSEQQAALLADPGGRIYRLPGIFLAPDDSFQITLEMPDDDLLEPYGSIQARLFRLLDSFHMPTQAKAMLAGDLPEIVSNPEYLGRYLVSLTDVQARALIEVLTGAGYHHSHSSGPERIILWNNRGCEQVRYRLAVEHGLVFQKELRFKEEAGVIPGFKAIYPNESFPLSNWRLRLAYLNMIDWTLQNEGNSALA